tara:strand:+ start:788 stop:1204 length:417 start_codon:yes stop_codon:yes gene_type:complete
MIDKIASLQEKLPFDQQFELFWMEYPRRKGKGAARKAFSNALNKQDLQYILEAAHNFAIETRQQDPKFIPHPATWLNQERYDDEPDEPIDQPLDVFKKTLLERSGFDPVDAGAGNSDLEKGGIGTSRIRLVGGGKTGE